MIPFNFKYYKPSTIEEALSLFSNLKTKGKQPIFYNGGTEIITSARGNRIYTEAVIDIKSIPECKVCQIENNKLFLGASISLTQVSEFSLFPLLSEAARGVADHTSRNKITLGGNICGKIPYREAVLPLLLVSTSVVIASEKGIKVIPLLEVFNRRLLLDEGEFLVQIIVDIEDTRLPYFHIKETRIGDVGYPLVTMVAIKKDKQIRIAFSGVTQFPFRAFEMEEVINQSGISFEEKVQLALEALHVKIKTDLHGTAEYRKFVIGNLLRKMLVELEEEMV